MHSSGSARDLTDEIQQANADIGNGVIELPQRDRLRDSIVAGCRLDLSGVMGCPSYNCMRETIDSTFKRVWHYFDQVVVEGLSPQFLADEVGSKDEAARSRAFLKIRDQARLLLYLREIGTDRFIIFSHKTHNYCSDCWLQHAKELGIAAAMDESRRRKIAQELIKTSSLSIEQIDSYHWIVSISGKFFDDPFHLVFRGGDVSADPEPKLEDVVEYIIAYHGAAMISDVELSRRLALPLVEPVSMPWITSRKSQEASCQEVEVAVRLNLPVFDNLPVGDFIKIREDERPEFETFRAALRTAIQQRLAENDKLSPAEIARSVEE